jgi:hypothetical protein
MEDLLRASRKPITSFIRLMNEALARLEALYRKRADSRSWRTAEAVPAGRSPLSTYTTLPRRLRVSTVYASYTTAMDAPSLPPMAGRSSAQMHLRVSSRLRGRRG